MKSTHHRRPLSDSSNDSEQVHRIRHLLTHLRELRQQTTETQSGFWRKYGVKQSGGSRYEQERLLPRPVQILLVLEALGHVTEEQLLEAVELIEKTGLPQPLR